MPCVSACACDCVRARAPKSKKFKKNTRSNDSKINTMKIDKIKYSRIYFIFVNIYWFHAIIRNYVKINFFFAKSVVYLQAHASYLYV